MNDFTSKPLRDESSTRSFILDSSPDCLRKWSNKLLAWGSKTQTRMPVAPGNVWSPAWFSEDKGVGSEGTGVWKRHQFDWAKPQETGRKGGEAA